MAMRQPIKNPTSALRPKSTAKAHVGDGLEAILQNNPQLRRLVVQAKDRGSVTFDQLNAALPTDFPPKQTEEVIQLLDAQGIMVLRDEAGGEMEGEPAEVEATGEGEPAPAEAEGEEATQGPEEELGRTDDPVRMYLREMGTIELLSREGEIEIAKRIEAGRNTVLEALCESPLTMRAVIGWRDAIREGRVLLRDIIDLEATNDSGPGADAAPVSSIAAVTVAVAEPGAVAVETAVAVVVQPEAADADGDADEDREPGGDEEDEGENSVRMPEVLEEEDFDEDTLSLSALENKLRDGVLETFDSIADAYRGLRELQEERLTLIQARREVPVELDREYQAARSGMVELMKQVSLNQSRVEALVQQLFDLNKHL